jgi:hypothetical protein
MNMGLPRHFWKLGLLICFLLSFPLAWDGKQRGPLPLSNDIFHSGFIPMEKLEDSSFELPIRIDHPARLSQIVEISIRIGTYFKTFRVTSAELRQSDSSCRFTLNAPFDLSDGGIIRLSVSQCSWGDQSDFILKIRGEHIDGLAVLGYQGISDTQNNPYIYAVDRDGKALPVAGKFLPSKTELSEYWPRIRLLAYMWNWHEDWIFFSLLFVAALGMVSFCLAYLIGLNWQRIEAKPQKLALVGFLLIVGLQLSYAFLSPPFQAPDEADHFISFSRLGGLTRAENEGLLLANQGHFDRLMCHVEEKFTKADPNFPMQQKNWNSFHVGYVDVSSRSAYANVVWPLISRLIFNENSSPEQVHLGLRVFNGFYFSVIFLVTLLIYRTANSFDIADYLWGLLLVPTLFHFSNHNSNHAFIISHYIPFVLAFRQVVTGQSISRIALVWIGLNLGLCFLSGRLGLIFLVVAYGSFMIRSIWLGSSGKKVDWKGSIGQLSDFVCVALPVALLVLLFRNSPYLSTQLDSLKRLTGLAGFLPILFFVAGVGALFLAFWIGGVVNSFIKFTSVAKYVRAIQWAAVIVLIVLLIFPIFKAMPPLINIEHLNPYLSGWNYTRKVLKHFVLTWGWGGADFFLIQSFWGGFGCPEPVVGNFIVQAIKGSLATITVLGFYHSARKGQWRLSLTLILCFGLLLANLSLLAFASAAQPSNLHGRYMVGFYLILIQTAILSFRGETGQKSHSSFARWAMISIASVHIASMWHVLARYF